MRTVYLEQLESLLETISQQMELYVPQANEECYTFERFVPTNGAAFNYNPIRTTMSPKDFVFPLREIAAVFPDPKEPDHLEPYAVLGLKSCDLCSLEILDRVFTEEPFEDPHYLTRRQQMVTITTDCTAPAATCFCNVMHGQSYAMSGFDLNVAPLERGYLMDIGSEKGQSLTEGMNSLLSEASSDQMHERDAARTHAQAILAEQNRHLHFDSPLADMMESAQDDEVFNQQAETCVECQACTRVCPTCHCFYLYDRKQQDYFNKLKMWDSCMRFSYARVAGGANPRTSLGDRLRHRLMHKFAYFVQRYGVDMCVGCGRCVDAEVGAVDIRVVLERINEAFGKQKTASP